MDIRMPHLDGIEVTVRGYLSGIQAKLGLRNRVEIAERAWENRVVGTA